MKRQIYLVRVVITLMIFLHSQAAHAQTEFDSLKRNSRLDTLYQPSQRPTFVTEFATLKISGFVQPALYFDVNNIFNNDLFVTSEIPTSEVTNVKFNRFHMSANQSRLGFSFKFPTSGKNITAFIEGDFFSSSRGTNTYFRLRHAYLTVGEFLIGQTWTNFGDVNASPNTLDLEGPNSMPASRVAQIRWTREINKNFSVIFAMEEPKADYTALDSAEAVKSAFPELVIKPTYTFSMGSWSNSVIYKPIIYTDKNLSFKKELNGWGYTSSLTLKLRDSKTFNPFGWKQKVINVFAIVGRGTQGSVNDFGGLGYEAFPKDSVTLAPLLYYGGYLSFSFVTNKRWSSTYVCSYLYQQKPALSDQHFKNSEYFSGNVVYAINKYFTIGGELLYGIKENYDHTSGTALRILGIMRLIF